MAAFAFPDGVKEWTVLMEGLRDSYGMEAVHRRIERGMSCRAFNLIITFIIISDFIVNALRIEPRLIVQRRCCRALIDLLTALSPPS